MAQPKDRNSSLIANCVFNAFLSCTAIMLNIITILALRKTSSMPKTLKTLLLSLAVSDIGVGLLVQPLYVAYLVMEMEQNTETQTFKITRASSIITRIFSFLGFVLWYCGSNCRQILGYSPSPEVPRTCDTQACCCCGDLILGIECNCCVDFEFPQLDPSKCF